ncbi:MAG: hypothetical protein A2236_08010 [Bacteroidetes bacterium RIFOXYA2_FULL_33_7]|nr:MAG: hypothetical protein A2236_08010 [Bacteroidetes bacterium RIFOXYA2_FULL_33_7]
MKTRIIKIIILLSAISLIGLLVTQLFWIKNAFKQSEELFDSRVSVAIKQALDEISIIDAPTENHYHCSHRDSNLFVNTHILDSLLKVHFLNHKLDSVFEFSIVKCKGGTELYSKSGVLRERIPSACHTAGLSCIWKPECYNLEVYFPQKQNFILLGLSAWLLFSLVFILIVIFSFTYIVLKLIKQKKISEIKNDFINNMTHEFKTPISTISIASEVLLKTDQKTSISRITKYSNIIYDENQRLKNLVDKILQIALIEKEDLKLNKIELDLHKLIQETIANLCLEHCTKEVSVNYHFEAKNFMLKADKIHLENVVTNLVNNAYKYSKNSPDIEIFTKNVHSGIVFSVKDKGEGISSEMQKQIFEKFYRVPTGNIHNVKGFGLGLYYVKSIVESHGGTVTVDSVLGEGSTFHVFLPFE